MRIHPSGCVCPVAPASFAERLFILRRIFLAHLLKSIDHKCKRLFLDVQFYSIDLHIWSYEAGPHLIFTPSQSLIHGRCDINVNEMTVLMQAARACPGVFIKVAQAHLSAVSLPAKGHSCDPLRLSQL